MTPNEEKEREAFERWVNENHNAEYISRNRFLRWMDDANNYVLPETSWAWAAWKAGRAALRAESEPVINVVIDHSLPPDVAELRMVGKTVGMITGLTAPQTEPKDTGSKK